ncbi:MAG: signal peptidase I [Catenulispora sp.]|nr:signal peptidase I [Catenulispora sp.]
MAATDSDAALGPEPGVPYYRNGVPEYDPGVSNFGTEAATEPLAAGPGGDATGSLGGEPDPAENATPTRGGGRRAAGKKVKKKRFPAWLEIIGYVVVSLVLTSLIKTFLVQMYYIPSPSMEPTTYKGDRVFVDKLSHWAGGAPTRGQVIVFHDPHNWMAGSVPANSGALNLPDMLAAVGILPDQHDDLLIKRIIGVAGDTIECKSADGPVYRNGQALDESSYIMNGKNGRPCANGTYKVVVPQGNLWVLGDNREHSGDSSWNYTKRGGDAGYVPTGNVVGHVIGVVSWLRADHPAGS